MITHPDGRIWTGSHSLCVWDETRNTHSDRLLTYTNGDKYVGQVTDSTTERNGRVNRK